MSPRPFLVFALALALASTGCAGLWGFDDLIAGDAGSSSEGGLSDAIVHEAEADAPLPPLSPYAQVVLADEPVAYYRLDETSGTTARDFSGHGNAGTYIGGVHLGTAGAIANDPDTAATFDGATGYIDCGDNFAFAGSQPFSLEAWVRSASMTGYGGVFSREDAAGGPPSEGYFVSVAPGDGMYSFQRLDGNNLTSVNSTSVASSAHYDHVVAAYNGNSMIVYVNGAAEQTLTATFPIAGAMNHFVVGAEAGGAEDFFDGALDEVAVYDRVLSANRVMAHYLVGTGQGP